MADPPTVATHRFQTCSVPGTAEKAWKYSKAGYAGYRRDFYYCYFHSNFVYCLRYNCVWLSRCLNGQLELLSIQICISYSEALSFSIKCFSIYCWGKHSCLPYLCYRFHWRCWTFIFTPEPFRSLLSPLIDDLKGTFWSYVAYFAWSSLCFLVSCGHCCPKI